MVDFDILTQSGTTRERLKEFFTAALPSERVLSKMEPEDRRKFEKRVNKDVERRAKFEAMISSWINEQVVFNLTNQQHFGALQMAWDSVPINKQSVPLMMYAQGRIDFERCRSALQTLPGSERFIKDKGGKQYLDLPTFCDMNINLVRSVITRRKAAQCNRFNNLWPFYKYEARSTGLVGKLRADLVSQRMDIMADQYDYRHVQEQEIRDMLLYPFCVSFPRASWEREVQWVKGGQAPEFGEKFPVVNRVIKEGIYWVTPDPSRVIYDNSSPLASINQDVGCEWIGHWDVRRWKDVAGNPQYFNKKHVTYERTHQIFTRFSLNFEQFEDRIVPPNVKTDVPAENDRLANVGIYTSEQDDASVFFTNLFVKVIPRQWGLGKYPYPVWLQLHVAGDQTVVFADIMPSSPAAYFGWNVHDGRLMNISMGHELMQFQDTLTNLFTKLLKEIQRDLFTVPIINEDAFPSTKEGREALDNFKAGMKSESWYADPSLLIISFERLREMGINVSLDSVFRIVRSTPNNAITEILQAIARVIEMADRLQSMTSQEQGQASPSGISATESSFLAGAKENMEEDIANAIDQGRAAKKRICYESWQACGEDVVTLPVVNRYTKQIIERAGLKVVEEDADDIGGKMVYNSITGSKSSLVHDYIFTSRDGTDRANNTQSAEVIVRLLTTITNAPEPVVKATLRKMGAQKYFDMINEVARLSSSMDLKLEVKPGETDDLLIEDENQVMAMIHQIAQAVEKNTSDIQALTEAVLKISQSLPPTSAAA